MTEPNPAANPLLAAAGLPLFDRIEPAHVVPGITELLDTVTSKFEAYEAALADNASPTYEDIFTPRQEIGRLYERSWGAVGHLMGTWNSDELREAHQEMQPKVVALGLKMSQSKPVYNALKSVKESAYGILSPARQRILDARLLDMELAGIGLPDDQQERFNEVRTELSRLATEFSNHVLDATKAWSLTINNAADMEGTPDSLKSVAAASYNDHKPDDLPDATPDAGPWRITMEAASFVPFMKHCPNRSYREQVYRAYMTRCSAGDLDNTPLITSILKLRKELASLLGYACYSDISLAEKMADDVPAVREMLENLRIASWGPAVQDLEAIRALAAELGLGDDLAHWDVAFYAERLREQRFDFSEDDLRPYLPHDAVLAGLFELAGRLFGISVEDASSEAPVWQSDVRFYKVLDNATGQPIAAFYYDPFSRPETKRPGAWMDECLSRRPVGEPATSVAVPSPPQAAPNTVSDSTGTATHVAGSPVALPAWLHQNNVQLPVAHLVCNATPPVDGQPALLGWREVETLFHEFGHGLQHMLTTVDEPEAAGISGVEWDAVELPSQFMENWCYHKPTVDQFARHVETGEPLPEDLFNKLKAARTYRAGSDMLRQINFGLTDLALHTEFDPDSETESIWDVHHRISETTSPLGLWDQDRFLCGFSHIFAGGYSAGYYSYKWAEVLSADAFAAFEDAGLDDPAAVSATGRLFRDTILSQGGSQHPMDLFTTFRGRQPTTDALLRHNGLATK